MRSKGYITLSPRGIAAIDMVRMVRRTRQADIAKALNIGKGGARIVSNILTGNRAITPAEATVIYEFLGKSPELDFLKDYGLIQLAPEGSTYFSNLRVEKNDLPVLTPKSVSPFEIFYRRLE